MYFFESFWDGYSFPLNGCARQTASAMQGLLTPLFKKIHAL
ncbi:hypothetical protein RICGR_0586 [Rickettsiella grylli]|uniref:Uncharacterized protein n=1 Tax=Rickettsiella grylli TaxID=59196 RepID=A8PM01_9COXI|nr:hypothetical protein RICGR_0586 [Rickettsiella grylli]